MLCVSLHPQTHFLNRSSAPDIKNSVRNDLAPKVKCREMCGDRWHIEKFNRNLLRHLVVVVMQMRAMLLVNKTDKKKAENRRKCVRAHADVRRQDSRQHAPFGVMQESTAETAPRKTFSHFLKSSNSFLCFSISHTIIAVPGRGATFIPSIVPLCLICQKVSLFPWGLRKAESWFDNTNYCYVYLFTCERSKRLHIHISVIFSVFLCHFLFLVTRLVLGGSDVEEHLTSIILHAKALIFK